MADTDFTSDSGVHHLRLPKPEPSLLDKIRSTWGGTMIVGAILSAGLSGGAWAVGAWAGKADAAQMSAIEARTARLEQAGAVTEAHLTDLSTALSDLRTDVRMAAALSGHALPPPIPRPRATPPPLLP